MTDGAGFRVLVLAVILLGVSAPIAPRLASAQSAAAGTSEVFRRFSDRTRRIQVTEVGSAAKASLGTGFFVDSAGHLITNYHVVSRLITDPGRYRAEVTDTNGDTLALTPIAIDVVNDLAVLQTPRRAAAFFTLHPSNLSNGARLYSLGHPRDLGLSIVEGTYNGRLRHTLYPKIHFTGALNPGMSGGPALDEGGSVVGVNVATEGDEVSFLVPVERAISLLSTIGRPGFAPPRNFMSEVARQIRDYQNDYVTRLFGKGSPTVGIGAYTLPTSPAPFFRCWADARRREKLPYEVVDHQCSTDDYLFISAEHSSGVIDLKHRVISSTRLNALRFSSLYSSEFQGEYEGMYADEEDVTKFECETKNVRLEARRFRTQLCVRRYRKLDGLYDAVLRAAALGPRRAGLVTTLTMSGVTFDNVQRLTGRYLELIAWRD